MALTVRLPRSTRPSAPASASPWDHRDGEAPPGPTADLRRVVLAVVVAIAALAIGVGAYSFSLARHDVVRVVPAATVAQTPMVSAAV